MRIYRYTDIYSFIILYYISRPHHTLLLYTRKMLVRLARASARRGVFRPLALPPAAAPATEPLRLAQWRYLSSEKDQAPEDEAAAGDDGADADSAGGDAADSLAAAEARVAELEEEVAEAGKKYLGVLAEMENVRRIAKNDVEKANTYAIQKFAKSLLGVSDNLGRALEAVPADALAGAPEDLLKVFKSHGIEKFGEEGDVFDPNRHDAMFEYEDAEKEAGTVGQVIAAGYSFKDRTLRPAQVGTVKKSS